MKRWVLSRRSNYETVSSTGRQSSDSCDAEFDDTPRPNGDEGEVSYGAFVYYTFVTLGVRPGSHLLIPRSFHGAA